MMGIYEQLVSAKISDEDDGDSDVKQVKKDDVKEDLLGKPFFITEWEFLKGKKGDSDYVKVTAVQPNDKTVSFIDGSQHGVYKQLKEYTDKNDTTENFYAKYGLTKDVFYKNMTTGDNSSTRKPGYQEVLIYSIAHK